MMARFLGAWSTVYQTKIVAMQFLFIRPGTRPHLDYGILERVGEATCPTCTAHYQVYARIKDAKGLERAELLQRAAAQIEAFEADMRRKMRISHNEGSHPNYLPIDDDERAGA